jgi:hypothetical protein
MPQPERSPSPFDLEAAVSHWRREAETLVTSSATVDELEDHLREQYAELTAAGRPADEAWSTAGASLGSLQRLGREFAKLQPLAAVDRFVLTSLVGSVAILAAGTLWFLASSQADHVINNRPLLRAHVATITLGYGSGLLAMVAAAYATLRSLFARQAVDAIHAATLRVVRISASVAVVMVVVGFALGCVWASGEWGRPFTGSPREIGGLLVALGFAAATVACTRRPRVALPIALVAGGLVLAAWLGIAAFSANFPAALTTIAFGGVTACVALAALSLRSFDRAGTVT